MQSRATGRFLFIDLHRGWAVLIMIETHVVNAVISPELRDQASFATLTFINGLVAPSFLFCAGAALAIVLHRKWSAFTRPSVILGKYLLRLLLILVIAYALHLPYFSLRRMTSEADDHAWMVFFQADILHAIVVALVASVLVAFVVRKQTGFLIALGAIATAVIFLAPLMYDQPFDSIPVWLRPYLTSMYKSQFPLFPWSAFLVGGIIVGWWYLHARATTSERKMMGLLAAGSAAAIVVALLAEFLPIGLYPEHNFWRASPEFFFVRFGLVCLIMAGLWLYEQARTPSASSPVSLFGQESLLVYVVHLLVVYGHTFEWSFIRLFGKTLSYAQCFGLFAALSVAMFALAYGWHTMKESKPGLARIVQYSVLSGFVLWFVLK